MARVIPTLRTQSIVFDAATLGIDMQANDILNVDDLNISGTMIVPTDKIKIGQFAGLIGQQDNTIVLNASGTGLNGDGNAGAFYVKPVREGFGPKMLCYNDASGEVTYGNNKIGSLKII